MTTTHNDARLPRRRARPQTTLARDAVDLALADEATDVNCIRELVALAERSARRVDDGMNAIEASEEQHAVAEAQTMREQS